MSQDFFSTQFLPKKKKGRQENHHPKKTFIILPKDTVGV